MTSDGAERCDEVRVPEDLACIRCGYNLRTLREDGVCPECGDAVAESLRYRGRLTPRQLQQRKLRYALANVLAFYAPGLLVPLMLSPSGSAPIGLVGFLLAGPLLLFTGLLTGCMGSESGTLALLIAVPAAPVIVAWATWNCVHRAKHPWRIPLCLFLASVLHSLILLGLVANAA
jgi:hypothetical protein